MNIAGYNINIIISLTLSTKELVGYISVLHLYPTILDALKLIIFAGLPLPLA